MHAVRVTRVSQDASVCRVPASETLSKAGRGLMCKSPMFGFIMGNVVAGGLCSLTVGLSR